MQEMKDMKGVREDIGDTKVVPEQTSVAAKMTAKTTNQALEVSQRFRKKIDGAETENIKKKCVQEMLDQSNKEK